jgi:hypothetical protein
MFSLQPQLIGYLTPNRLLSEWRVVFYISCAFLTITNLVFIIWGSAKTQPWDNPRRKEITGIENGEVKENGVVNTTQNNDDYEKATRL